MSENKTEDEGPPEGLPTSPEWSAVPDEEPVEPDELPPPEGLALDVER